MSTMYDRIAFACKEQSITPGFMCDSLGIRRSFMTELKTGRTRNLSCEKVEVIARFLHVSCDYIINGNEYNSEFSKDEIDLIHAFRIAPLSDRENIKFILRNYMPVPEEKPNGNAV